EDQKQKFLATQQGELEGALGLAVFEMAKDREARRQVLDVWLRRKGVILEAQKRYQEALVYSDDPQAQAVFQDLARVRARLSKLAFSPPGKDLEAYRKQIADLEKEKDRLEAELARLSQAFAEQGEKRRADAARVAAALPPGTLLLEFGRIKPFDYKATGVKSRWGPARYLAFVLPAGGADQIGLVDLGPAEPIDQAITDFKQAVADTRDLEGQKASAAAGRLHDLVFARLKPELGRTTEIFISPDGQLNLIPFEVLRGPDGRYLIEDYTFYYLASGRDVLGFGRRTDEAGPSLLMGGPDYDLSGPAMAAQLRGLGLSEGEPLRRSPDLRGLKFSPLPGTLNEVREIADLLGEDQARVYTGPQALEEVLLSVKAPRILHLATHGFFLEDQDLAALAGPRGLGLMAGDTGPAVHIENPLLRSGLALAGANAALAGEDLGSSEGLLTAEKVLGLKLRGTDLVVLSACETGAGAVKTGEGVYGLRRAFVQAGTRGLVMSLWAVPDEETRELMVRFYRNVGSGRMNRGQALRRAALEQMKTARERYGGANPLFWGAFVYLDAKKGTGAFFIRNQ
ncbi:MAG: CHAT domain-containing protein, partial [Thermodesulfobacteriota bacterium]